MNFLLRLRADTPVDPDPIKGSRTVSKGFDSIEIK